MPDSIEITEATGEQKAGIREALEALGGGGVDDAVGNSPNADGGRDLVLWNETQALYQRVRIIGIAGEERLKFIDTE